MRRNYILFNFPWVLLSLQRQKASLEVPDDCKKSQPPNWESETALPQTSLVGNWKLLSDGPNTRIQNQEGRDCLGPPCREGVHHTSYSAVFMPSSSPARYPRLLQQTLWFLHTCPRRWFTPATERQPRCHGAFSSSLAGSECRWAWAATWSSGWRVQWSPLEKKLKSLIWIPGLVYISWASFLFPLEPPGDGRCFWVSRGEQCVFFLHFLIVKFPPHLKGLREKNLFFFLSNA